MGKLNIAHHKSYHPYKAENVERVRRDEERAAALEAGDRAKVMQADSEARIAMLRKKARKGKSKEEDAAEKSLERQLQSKGRRAGDAEDGVEEAATSTTSTRVAKPSQNGSNAHATITTKEGHFNFFADLERGPTAGIGSSNGAASQRSKRNADYEAEKKAEEEKWDRQITMYLEAPPKTWYDSQDGLKPNERVRTEDQRLERTYKDNEVKRVEDPLATMQAYLERREQIKAAEERHKANPWDDTPRTLRNDRTPVQPSLLSKRRYERSGRHHPVDNHGDGNMEEGPIKPPKHTEPPSAIEKSAKRESSERERARALLAARRKESESVNATPRSEFGYQTGMYNRAETRDAKRYLGVRWNDERRDYHYRAS